MIDYYMQVMNVSYVVYLLLLLLVVIFDVWKLIIPNMLCWPSPLCSLPIRLTPMTATCRVLPLSRVKLGIGWSRGVARDAEQ